MDDGLHYDIGPQETAEDLREEIWRVRRARQESHEIRREIPPVQLDTLYERDELYEVWLAFLTDVLPSSKD